MKSLTENSLEWFMGYDFALSKSYDPNFPYADLIFEHLKRNFSDFYAGLYQVLNGTKVFDVHRVEILGNIFMIASYEDNEVGKYNTATFEKVINFLMTRRDLVNLFAVGIAVSATPSRLHKRMYGFLPPHVLSYCSNIWGPDLHSDPAKPDLGKLSSILKNTPPETLEVASKLFQDSGGFVNTHIMWVHPKNFNDGMTLEEFHVKSFESFIAKAEKILEK